MPHRPIVKTGASTATAPKVAARELRAAIAQPDAASFVFHCGPNCDLEELGAALYAVSKQVIHALKAEVAPAHEGRYV